MLSPLICRACSAPLAVSDSASVTCPYCGAENPVSEAHREALRAARNLDEATRLAAAEWERLRQIRVPRWVALATALLPFGLLAGGLGTALVVASVRPDARAGIPHLMGLAVFLPIVPLTVLATRTGLRNLLTSGAALVAGAFASRPASTPGAPDECRQCGAPLSVGPEDVVARCVYCGVESIIPFDAEQRSRFASGVATANTSLADAVKALADRAALVAVQTRGRLAVIVVLLAPPLFWSFAGEPIQGSWWSLAIALCVWVLAICLFWYVRESLLPPVTIEALQSVIAGGADRTPAAATKEVRGWYDNAFEAINFAVPAAVATLFLIVQVAVLLAVRS